MIEALLDALLDAVLDAVLDPWPPFTFCCPQAIVDEEAGVSIPNSSPFSRSTMLPFTSTPSPPAPLAIREAPSGRRRKSRRQSHKFFKHLLRLAPQLAATPWGGFPPRPLCQKICYQTAQKTALCAPASTQEVRNPKIGQPLGAQPTPRFRWRFR